MQELPRTGWIKSNICQDSNDDEYFFFFFFFLSFEDTRDVYGWRWVIDGSTLWWNVGETTKRWIARYDALTNSTAEAFDKGFYSSRATGQSIDRVQAHPLYAFKRIIDLT